MKKPTQALALLLCALLALSLAACGGPGGNAPAATGRYVETDITPPGAEGETLRSFLTPEGSLVCFGQGLIKRWDSADGGATWQESEGPGAKETRLANAWLYTLLPGGDIVAALPSQNGDSTGELLRVTPDGIASHFAVPRLDEAIAEGKKPYVSLLTALSDERLLLSYSTGMSFSHSSEDGDEDASDASEAAESETAEENSASQDAYQTQETFTGLIDPATGAVVADFPEWYGTCAAARGDKLYMMDYSGGIQTKSLADGSDAGGELTAPVGEFAFNLAMDAGEDGRLYVLDGKRVHKLAADGTAETLMDGSSYSFAGRGMAIGLHALPGGALVMNLDTQDGGRLYKYAWDESATVDPNKVLKVWSLRENSLVRAAVSVLRAQNPDMTVEYEIALGEDTAATAEDAVKNLNTRLLNGDGPDVLVLDGCPVDSYIQQGMLQNLDGLVDTSGMFQNLLAPFKQDGSLYVLPGSFKVPLLLGTGQNLAKAQNLAQLAQMVADGNTLPELAEDGDVFAQLDAKDQPVLAPQDLREVFDCLWNASAPAVVTGTGLDSDAARQLLAALQTISDKYRLAHGGGSMSGAMAVMSSGGAASTVKGSVLAYASQRAVLGGYLADDAQMLDYMMEPPGSEFASFPGLTKGAWLPGTLVGVSADSDKTELAAQLVQTMLSVEVQGVRTGNGFSVTPAGMDKMIADTDKLMRENQGTGFSFDYQPLVDLAARPVLVDAVLTETVWAAAESMCNGEIDLEEAVKQVEQGLKNYLAERQ